MFLKKLNVLLICVLLYLYLANENKAKKIQTLSQKIDEKNELILKMQDENKKLVLANENYAKSQNELFLRRENAKVKAQNHKSANDKLDDYFLSIYKQL